MITRISGVLRSLDESSATIDAGVFDYEVLLAGFSCRQLAGHVGESISLHTLHYLEGNPTQGRLTPRLVGFQSHVEREFFEMFCSVDGVGVRKALRAMTRPVQDVAVMIAEQDSKGLTTLPGIGAATSDRVIAKLRRKMSKFALLVTQTDSSEDQTDRDIVEETFATLCELGHSESDARRMLDGALAEKPKHKDVGELLQAVYSSSREE